MVDVEVMSAETAVADRPPIGEHRRDAGFTAAELQTGSVFVTTGGVRAQALRWSGYLMGTMTLLWLVALIAGAVGAGRLPAVPFPAIGALRETHPEPARQPAAPQSALQRATVSGEIAGRGRGVLSRPAPPGSRSGSATPGSTGVRFVLPPADGRSAPGRGVGLSAPVVVSPQPAVGAAPPVAPPASGTAPRTTPPPTAGRGSGAATGGRRSGGASKAPAASAPAAPPAVGRASGTGTTSTAADPPTATPGAAHRHSAG